MRFPRAYLDAIPYAALFAVSISIIVYMTIFLPVTPESTQFVFLLMTPPFVLMAILVLARLEMEAGNASKSAMGELEHLLHQKRGGLLDLSRPRFESRLIDELTKVQPIISSPVEEIGDGNTLDRLVQWKHQRRSAISSEDLHE